MIVEPMRLQHLPNIITYIRCLLVLPIIIVLLNKHYTLAFYLFIFAGVSDAADGLIARVYGWTSQLGAVLDPLADKLLLVSSYVTLGYLGHFSFWLVTLVVARDIWIIFGGVLYRYVVGHLEFKPSFISKINTFLQILLVGLMLIHLSFYHFPAIVLKLVVISVVISGVASMVHYTWAWSRLAAKNRSAA